MAMEVGPNLPGVASEVLPVAPPSVVPPTSEVPPSGSGAAAGAAASDGAPGAGLHSATQDGESPASLKVISPDDGSFPTFADDVILPDGRSMSATRSQAGNVTSARQDPPPPSAGHRLSPESIPLVSVGTNTTS